MGWPVLRKRSEDQLSLASVAMVLFCSPSHPLRILTGCRGCRCLPLTRPPEAPEGIVRPSPAPASQTDAIDSRAESPISPHHHTLARLICALHSFPVKSVRFPLLFLLPVQLHLQVAPFQLRSGIEIAILPIDIPLQLIHRQENHLEDCCLVSQHPIRHASIAEPPHRRRMSLQPLFPRFDTHRHNISRMARQQST